MSLVLSVSNPVFDGDKDNSTPSPRPDETGTRSSRTMNRGNGSGNRRSVASLVGGLAIVAVGFVVGFASGGGFSVADSSPTAGGSSTEEEALSTTDRIRTIVELNPEINNISPEALNELMNKYTADPDSWRDPIVPNELMRLISEQMAEDGGNAVQGGTRLRDADRDERDLGGRFNKELVNAAFEMAYNHGFPDPIVASENGLNDRGSVVMTGSRCFIYFDDSQSLRDWINNLNVGNGDVLSIKEYNTQGTSKHIAIARAYNGFRRPWNALRLRVAERIETNCTDAAEYVFAGFSRGGAIAAIAAGAMYKEGLLPASKMKLVTFGCPRVFTDSFSDEVHNKFEQWRMINRKDPVPSIPYGWLGLKHYGEMRCRECGYSESRDRPGWANILNTRDHPSYDTWFPVA